MKQRLISAAVGIPIAVIVLFFYNTILLNIAITAITLLAVYEIFVATKYVKNLGLTVICFIYAAIIPFFHISRVKLFAEMFSFLFVLALFIFLMTNHKTLRIEQIGTAFLLTLMLSFSFSSIVYIRDIFEHNATEYIGLFYVALVFLGAWITDAGAYFIGRFFGRTKLSPDISPKKTVEGAVGGIICTMIIFNLAAFGYHAFLLSAGITVRIDFISLFAAAFLSAVTAILGDLSASLIKREFGVKDFGNIMPGHGGIMDRFDSIMFVAPLLFIYIQLFPIIR